MKKTLIKAARFLVTNRHYVVQAVSFAAAFLDTFERKQAGARRIPRRK